MPCQNSLKKKKKKKKKRQRKPIKGLKKLLFNPMNQIAPGVQELTVSVVIREDK